jgi:pimeloyl-ACP methyl ester carboxylesterase
MRGFVLIHGGATTGRFWDRLVPLLDRPSVAPDLPGRGDRPCDPSTLTIETGVAAIVDDVVGAGFDDVVLVAHSAGGLFVPATVAACRARQIDVAHVVLSAASVPPEGGNGLDCMKPRHRAGTLAMIEHATATGEPMLTPGPPDDPELLREGYGERVDDDTLHFIADPVRFVPESFTLYLQPVHYSQLGDVPVTYVRNRRDRPVPPALQDEMIARLPSRPRIVDLDAGHAPAVTQPRRFADLVNAVARGDSAPS